jgi:urease accessory protein
MTGSLRLIVGLDDVGRCALREQYCSQLHRVLHLIPGDVPEEGLVYVLNPTGGLLEGDRLEAEIRVERGAHAIVTTPSATKLHRADDRVTESRTRLHVAAGGMLEFIPEPIIPFAGSRFIEDLSIELEAGAKLFAWEILAPGRAARGELFAYQLLGLRLTVREAGRTILREHSLLRPSCEKLGRLVMGEATHYGVLLVLGGDPGRLESRLREQLGGLQAGVSRLPGTGVIVKALSTSGQDLDRLFRGLRELACEELAGRRATSLRPI